MDERGTRHDKRWRRCRSTRCSPGGARPRGAPVVRPGCRRARVPRRAPVRHVARVGAGGRRGLPVRRLAPRRPARGREWLQVEPRWTGLGWDDAWGAACASSPGGSGVTTARHTRVNFAFDESANAVRRGEFVPPDGWVARRATAEDFGWLGGSCRVVSGPMPGRSSRRAAASRSRVATRSVRWRSPRTVRGVG